MPNLRERARNGVNKHGTRGKSGANDAKTFPWPRRHRHQPRAHRHALATTDATREPPRPGRPRRRAGRLSPDPAGPILQRRREIVASAAFLSVETNSSLAGLQRSAKTLPRVRSWLCRRSVGAKGMLWFALGRAIGGFGQANVVAACNFYLALRESVRARIRQRSR